MSEQKPLTVKTPPTGARSFTSLGQVVITRSLSDLMADSEVFSKYITNTCTGGERAKNAATVARGGGFKSP